MANPEHLALLKKCIEAKDFAEWNAWLKAKREQDEFFCSERKETCLDEARWFIL